MAWAGSRAATGLAGGYLALAGCLSALQYGFVGPTSYNFALSVQMLFGVVVGGMHSVAGAIIGGLVLEFLPGIVAGLGKGLSALLYAMLLIAAIVAMPNGIAGAVTKLLKRRPHEPFKTRARFSTEAPGGSLWSSC